MTVPTQEDRRQGRRGELLDAAIGAIRELGPTATMEQLARAGGVTKPILYRHFRDRDGLVVAITERFLTDVISTVTAPLQGHAPVRDRLRSTIDSHVSLIERDPHVYRFLVRHAPERRDSRVELESLIDTIAREVAAAAGQRLRQAGRDGSAAVPWAYGIVGLVHQAGDWWVDDQTMSREELVDHLTSLLWDGVGGLAEA